MKLLYTLIAGICIVATLMATTDSSTAVNAQQATSDESNVPSQESPEEEKSELSKFMRQKLAASNQILEGLVTDDLNRVEKGADKLLKMSAAEHWLASNDMMYMHHSRVFRDNVETMQEKAKKKSIDGAALAWMDVTLSCIKCHEWVRDTMLADSGLDGVTSFHESTEITLGLDGGDK